LVRTASKHLGRGAGGGHADQTIANHLQVLGLVAKRCNGRGAHGLLLVGQSVLRGLHHVRCELVATVGQNGGGRGQLQHGEGVVALTNAQ
jgi:hypothetical protein